MEQSLADRGDGDELIDTKLGVCIRRTADYDLPKYASSVFIMGISLLIKQ